ncbi:MULTISPECIES: hypothetical protein [Cysteiniphilum]|uniref:Uncharacterized protein n=1 Tax=Cysteiniphilum litorale TaxID=2056700 RepID=A0A8J2Z6I5_9GAMM|nr:MULTISPECIES: hypothetical protein [Cysteiniphilum]GGG06232.1 hypothetical protein GCM10010995_24680 [Cysteiniphilum litorale]
MSNQKQIQALQFEVLQKLGEMVNLVDDGKSKTAKSIPIMAVVLAGCVSTVADLLELNQEGASYALYKETEAAIQQGGLKNIRKKQASGGVKYSISDIGENDFENGMNYLGQELSTTLFSSIHELPETMRKPEMLLRGVECLLANLLNQKFRGLGDVHNILDSLCDHVHMNLKALDNKVVPIK